MRFLIMPNSHISKKSLPLHHDNRKGYISIVTKRL